MIGCLSVDAALILVQKSGRQHWFASHGNFIRVTAQGSPRDWLRYTTFSAGVEFSYKYSGAISILPLFQTVTP